MSDLGFDDIDDEEMIDPHFEKPSLDLLKQIADNQNQLNALFGALLERLDTIARLTAADRETEAIGPSGRKLMGKSRIILP